jgi:allantoin racemase
MDSGLGPSGRPGMTKEAIMSGRPRIRVVNPNSNTDVTRGIDDAVAPLRFADGPEIVCSTLAEGPFGVETQEHVESVALPLRRLV